MPRRFEALWRLFDLFALAALCWIVLLLLALGTLRLAHGF